MATEKPSGALLDGLQDLLERAIRLRAQPQPDRGSGPLDERARLAPLLEGSVIRPLKEGLALYGKVAGGSEATSRATGLETVWDLALRATTLRAAARPPPALLEATAALQGLACETAAESPSVLTERMGTLQELQKDLPAEICVSHNGPLLVTNVPLRSWLGESLFSTPETALCRCGKSARKPYCDGSHAINSFRDDKDPGRVADRADTYLGQQVTVLDNRGICQHSGFCSDRLPTVFRVKGEPFVAPSGGRMDEIMRAVRDCPSGALSYAIDGVEARAVVDWNDKRPPGIEVSKDGPLRITGGVALVDENGQELPRAGGASREHFALCRCGHSRNKPFCSGMHWYVQFQDPPPVADHAPTIFEWAGGLPALTRMTRLFYEKFVPQDELLAPLFASMSVDHPQRVAKWLGEVFCGPKLYTEQHGGYPRMLSQHRGKQLTEEMRARWVSLLLQAAREAGLPNDPEFRSAFQSYIEWGSRLAVENSQTDSQPPLKMPVPHWDWTTAAGPPGSRMSALAHPESPPEFTSHLPAPGEPLRFEPHVRSLFRERDRQSMRFAFDLSSHADVSQHAEAILDRVRNGTMPCDRAWPTEMVDAFARWIAAGKPP
jgi:CDGSH-type Zn-finger protein/truncated hemoglobin YjbI